MAAAVLGAMNAMPAALIPVPQRADLAMREVGDRQGVAHLRVVLHAVAVLGLLGFMGWSMF
jgi:hypothetical protein